MAEYFPNLMRTIYLQIQEDHQISGSTKRKHNKHIIVKLLKTTDKKNIFKAAIEGREDITHPEKQRITTSLSETMPPRRQCALSLKILKKKISLIPVKENLTRTTTFPSLMFFVFWNNIFQGGLCLVQDWG